MRRRELALALAGAAAGLAGCATSRDNVDPAAQDLSVVAGYIDMADAPSNVRWVSIKAYGPGADHHYRTRVVDGVFFHVGVEPGSYQVDRFGGSSGIPGFIGSLHEYEWGVRGRNGTAVRIERPAVYFLGSWRYAKQPRSAAGASFDMERLSMPGEREVLARVLRTVEADAELRVYTTQVQRLRKRVGARSA